MKKPPAKWLYDSENLKKMGENIRLARISRGFSISMLADQAGICRKLLYHVEKGMPTVSVGAIYSVLFVLGLEKDLSKIAYQENNRHPIMPGQQNRFFRSTMERRKKRN